MTVGVVDGVLAVTQVKVNGTTVTGDGITAATTTIENTYSAGSTAYAPNVTKSFVGDNSMYPEEGFTFVLSRGDEKDGVTMPTSGLSVTIYKTDENLTKAFSAVTFTEADTYKFKITEQPHSGTTLAN